MRRPAASSPLRRSFVPPRSPKDPPTPPIERDPSPVNRSIIADDDDGRSAPSPAPQLPQPAAEVTSVARHAESKWNTISLHAVAAAALAVAPILAFEVEIKESLIKLNGNDPHVQEFEVNKRSFDGDEFSQLLEGMEKSQHLRKLLLYTNCLSNKELTLLSHSISFNSTIRVLVVNNNNITAATAECFAQMLARNRTLRHLDLSNNRLGPAGVRLLSAGLTFNSGLDTLFLSKSLWGHAGGSSIEVTGLGDLGMVSFPHLLLLWHPSLTSRLYVALLWGVVDVGWPGSSTEMGDQGMEYLAGALRQNNTLRILNLAINVIGPAGIRELALVLMEKCPLAALDLSHNHLQDIGAAKLGEALPRNDGLLDLRIAFNRITGKGCTAFFQGLAVNKTLRYCSLRRSGGHAPGIYIAPCLCHLMGSRCHTPLRFCSHLHPIIPTLPTLIVPSSLSHSNALEAVGAAALGGCLLVNGHPPHARYAPYGPHTPATTALSWWA
ncbi:hypothetical protein PAPYR_4514 [Paratrimastix pyriformis]|uniref:Uncharacterized protein n=1 Tax=Paratrimastix pyriformis TaxID=342808 RepID=A0ABQ8UN87_9EUKA|nr:hypothetical protein PAPYR_4514 [Paratrimastix pyriformis]